MSVDPGNIGYCHVTWRVGQAVADGSDPDHFPDWLPQPDVEVQFIASPARVRVPSSPLGPLTILPRPIAARTDANGILRLWKDGIFADEPGVYLVASNDPDMVPFNWTWMARIQIPGSTSFDVSFVASDGVPVDLTNVIPVPAQPGQTISQWIDTVLQAQAAAGDAIEAKVVAIDAAARAEASVIDTTAFVDGRLAQQPAVVSAAALAVGTEVAGLDLVEGSDSRLPQGAYSDTLAFAVTDEDGNASWLATTPGGGIPEHAAEAIMEKIDAVALVEDARVEGQGWGFVLVDSEDRVSEFALDKDGSLSDMTIAAIAARIEVAASTPATGLTVAGDSISALQGNSGRVYWSQLLADDLGLPLYNPSVAGESSADIATRSGAVAPLLTFTGGVIPPTVTPVAVTVTDPSNGYRTLSGGVASNIGEFEGTVAGILGTLKHSTTDGSWAFTRRAAGSEPNPVPSPARFTTQDGKAHRQDIWIMWPGRNNPNTSQVLRDVASMVGFLTGTKRFLVLSVLPNSGEPLGSPGRTSLNALNATLAATYPDNFVDVVSYLLARGLSDAGLTATEDDTADLAAGLVPRSLRADATHPNQAGQIPIRNLLLTTINQKGWATR